MGKRVTHTVKPPPSPAYIMSGPLYRDPWAKREAWRKHPVFSNRAMFSNLFPGLGIAIVAFGAYVLVDNLIHPEPAQGQGRGEDGLAVKESTSVAEHTEGRCSV